MNVATSGRPQKGLQLLEVGVRWPPETFLRQKLEALAASGLRVIVASRAIFDAEARLPGVVLLEIPPSGISRWRQARVLAGAGLVLLVTAPRRLARLWRSIRRVPPAARSRYGGTPGLLAMYARLARLRPDVVHFEWTTSATAYMALFEVWRCPVVVSCRGTIDPHIPGREHHLSRLPELFRRADAVHCVSESLEREVVGLGLDPSKARVIATGVDPLVFRPPARDGTGNRRPDDGIFRIVTIGWLRWMKGYEYALEAIGTLVARGMPTRYSIIGAAPPELRGRLGERERILHTVADLELGEHVHLRGGLGTAEIVAALQGSDVLLHPSIDEGLPNVVVEAMACGVPVVATDCGGVGEALVDGVQGLLVRPRDPDALAAALERLGRSPALRGRMGDAGRATVFARFTLERHRDQFLSLYRELASR